MTKTATLLRQILVSLTAGAAVAVFALPSAPVLAAATQSFQISPPTATFANDHGTSAHAVVKVTNLTNEPISLTVHQENFVAKGEEGEVELVDNADPLYSLAPWFHVSVTQLDLPAHATKEVPYTIDVPANAEPGGRFGSIVFHSVPPKLPSGQSGASVEQDLGNLIFMRINGPADENLEVASFTVDKSFSEYGPVQFTTRIKNTGHVHEKPTGTIVIKNWFGAKVATIPLDEHYVIPASVRKLTNNWPTGKNKPFLIGTYTAEMTAHYAGNKTLTAKTSFTIIPWKLITTALVILILVILFFWRGRKRLARAARILAGRE